MPNTPVTTPITQNAFASNPNAQLATLTQLLREIGFSSCGPEGIKMTAENFNAVNKWFDDRMLILESQTDNVLTAIQDDSQILRFTDFDGNELVVDVTRYTRTSSGTELGQTSFDLTNVTYGIVLATSPILTIDNPSAVYPMRGTVKMDFDSTWDIQAEGQSTLRFEYRLNGGVWQLAKSINRIQENSDFRSVNDSFASKTIDGLLVPSGTLTVQTRCTISTVTAFKCNSNVLTNGEISSMFTNSLN